MPDDAFDPNALPAEAWLEHGSWNMLLNSPRLTPEQQAQFAAADDRLKSGIRDRRKYPEWRIL